MTEEELEEKAEGYAHYTRIEDENTHPQGHEEPIYRLSDFEGNLIDITERIKKTYKDGYEQCQKDLFEWTDREQLLKENAELKAKIEKMKCCGNCGSPKPYQIENPCTNCKNKDKWELAE